MFKKLCKAFTVAVLVSAPVMAADATGTYVAQSPQGPVTLELHGGKGRLGGTFHFQGSDFPCVAGQNGDNIRGTFKGRNGRMIGFAGSIHSGTLDLTMLGTTFQFQPPGANAASPVSASPAPAGPAAASPTATGPAAASPAPASPAATDPANPLDATPADSATTPTPADSASAADASASTAPVPDAAAPGAVGDQQLQTRQGKSLQCDVPAGWSFSDTNNGVDSMAPDGITWMSRTFFRGVGRTTPDQMMQRASRGWASLGMTNVQVVSSRSLGSQSKLYELNYLFHNKPAHAAVQATVNPGPAGYMANMITLQSSREGFQQKLPLMTAMAKSVRVTDPNQFVNNGKLNQLAQQRSAIAAKSARDTGDITINGEKARGAVRDLDHKGADDTLRSDTRFTDADGKEYTPPLQATRAFKHANGSVTYTSDISAPVPTDATELSPFDYSGR